MKKMNGLFLVFCLIGLPIWAADLLVDDFNDGDDTNGFGGLNETAPSGTTTGSHSYQDPGYGNLGIRVDFNDTSANSTDMLNFCLFTSMNEPFDISAYGRIRFDCMSDLGQDLKLSLTLSGIDPGTSDLSALGASVFVMESDVWESYDYSFENDCFDIFEHSGRPFDPTDFVSLVFTIEAYTATVSGTLWIDNIQFLEGTAVDRPATSWGSLRSLFRKQMP